MASPTQVAGTVLRYAAPLLVIAAAVVAARALIAARKAPPKVERPARILPVIVVDAQPFSEAARLEAYGVVRPRSELSVRPVVGGPVLEVHPNMIVGGRIARGETLFKIDPRDYELAVSTAEAALAGSRADLAIEEGTAAVAKAEWELLDGAIETTDAGRSLALREPYVARRRSEVASAIARVQQAELDLARTEVKAPFDAIVLSESLEVGAQVGAGTEVARIVDTATFLVEVTVPADRAAELDFTGTAVRVSRSGGAMETSPREGELLRLTGEVDPAGRMARAQVAIDAPLGGSADGGDPLLLGSYVRVELPLQPIADALVIPRSALREGDVVWLADSDGKLEIRSVEVTLRRTGDVLVSEGL
ncbi:MAG: efflux RND transporter periplasmic adaptor subunit, partial [Planctomycetota bacterium]